MMSHSELQEYGVMLNQRCPRVRVTTQKCTRAHERGLVAKEGHAAAAGGEWADERVAL